METVLAGLRAFPSPAQRAPNIDDIAEGAPSRDALLEDWRMPEGSPLGQLTVLYDLAADVGERKSLAAERPELVRRLIEELDAWEKELVPASVVGTRATLARVDGAPVEIIF